MRGARARLLAAVALALCVPATGAAVALTLSGPEARASAPEAAAHRFLDTYLDPTGRVVRRDQGGDTVSEGQAYAMLIAVAVGDRPRFDLAWDWARANLQRPDGLLSWHWADDAVTDRESAADADLDAARALTLAAERFAEPAYAAEGARIAAAILSEETVRTPRGPLLVAGPWARGPVARLNPSYFSPRAYADLSAASGDAAWAELAASTGAVVADLTLSPPGLPPNWADAGPDGAVTPAPGPGATPSWGLDAARVQIRFAESCSADDRALAARAWPFLRDVTRAGDVALDYTLDGTPTTEFVNPLGLVAAAAAASAAGDGLERDALLDRAEALGQAYPTYYGVAWIALGRLMLTTDSFGSCTAPPLSERPMNAPVPSPAEEAPR